MKNLKYIPKTISSVSFFILIILVFSLFQGRKTEFFRIENILKVMPEFYTHISNFSISYMLFSGIGYFWLMSGVKFKFIVLLGISILACNFIYEFYIPILNTPDHIDAYFGFAGTFLSFLFLILTAKFGLKLNPVNSENN